jgi:hypothetical protein
MCTILSNDRERERERVGVRTNHVHDSENVGLDVFVAVEFRHFLVSYDQSLDVALQADGSLADGMPLTPFSGQLRLRFLPLFSLADCHFHGICSTRRKEIQKKDIKKDIVSILNSIRVSYKTRKKDKNISQTESLGLLGRETKGAVLESRSRIDPLKIGLRFNGD